MEGAFLVADDILRQGVVGISEIIIKPGLINVDFADVRSIMTDAGTALMGIGQSKGKDRAAEAAGLATSCPLLDSQFTAAKAVVFNICGPPDLTLAEVNAAAGVIYENVAADANIIFGAVIDENERPDLQVTAIAAGFASGVSDEFLAPTEEPIPRTKVKPVAAETEPEIPEMAANEAQTEPSRSELVLNPDVPESLDLFPADREEDQQEEEKEEDVGIPTFLRNRVKKIRKKSS